MSSPEQEDPVDQQPFPADKRDAGGSPPTRAPRRLAFAIAALLLVTVVVLHLTGVIEMSGH